MEARPLISLSEAALFNVSGRAPCHCPMARHMSGTASLEHRELDVRASDWQRYAPIMDGPAVPAVSLTHFIVLYRTWSIFAEALAWRLRL